MAESGQMGSRLEPELSGARRGASLSLTSSITRGLKEGHG